MSIITRKQAHQIAARLAAISAEMRREADEAEAAGNPTGAQALRDLADSRERAGRRAHAGARVGRA